MKTIEEMLEQNDFKELAKDLRMAENETTTSIMIDLADGEVWTSVVTCGEVKKYKDDTIITLMIRWHVPHRYRNERVIKNKAISALTMYYHEHLEPFDIERYIYNEGYDNSAPKNIMLPLGSVIKKGDSDYFMICGMKRSSDNESFKYKACPYPSGAICDSDLIDIDSNEIAEVICYAEDVNVENED